MKRIIGAATIGIVMTALSTPAFAAGVPQYGSVKLNWSVNTQASMQIVTQYANHAFTQGSAAIALEPSAAGVCGNSAAETAFNLSYGALNPSLTTPVGCNYPSAVAVSVTTNDSNGFAVTQVVDSTASVGSYVGFCSFPNTGAVAGRGGRARRVGARRSGGGHVCCPPPDRLRSRRHRPAVRHGR